MSSAPIRSLLSGAASAVRPPLVEDLAFDRGVFEQAALVGFETVEAGGQERLDRRRHDDLTVTVTVIVVVVVAVGDEGDHLFEEERVAGRRCGDAGPGAGRQPAAAGEAGDQRGGRLRAERVKQQRAGVGLAVGPGRALLEELRSGQADDQDGDVADGVGEVLDQVQQCRLGPVDVLEDQQQRSLAGERLGQLADGPEDLFPDRAGGAGADGALQPRGDGDRVGHAVEQRAERPVGGGLRDDLA